MEEFENNERNGDERDSALVKVETLFQSPDLESKTKEAAQLVKKSVRVTDDFFATSIKVFKDHGLECFGIPHESDFQLDH